MFELYFIERVSKLIPSPFKVSVKPFKSASVKIFANVGALLSLKLFIVNSLIDKLSLNLDTKYRLPPSKPLKNLYSVNKGTAISE